MNLSKEVLGKVVGHIQAAAYSAFTSECKSVEAEGFYPWEVIIRHVDDGKHMGNDDFSLCGVCLGLVNRDPFERCKFAVEHGLGFASDNNPAAGKAFCITISWRLKPIYHAYVLLNSDDADLIEKDFRDFVAKLDRQLWSLGDGWLIGGALPDGYIRLGEDDIVIATARSDGYSLEEKVS